MQYFDQKDPGESVVLTYDFTLGIPAGKTLTGSPTVEISVRSGADANPTAVLAGGNSIASPLVYVPVTGGLDAVQYDVKVTVSTTDPHTTLVLAGVLPVVAV